MSLVFLLISIVLTYFNPSQVMPSFAIPHLQQAILLPAIFSTLIPISAGRSFMQMPQFPLVIAFWFAIVMSDLAKLWFGGAWVAFYVFASVACVYFLTALNTFTLTRLKCVAATVILCALVACRESVMAYFADDPTSKLLNSGRIQGRGIISDPNDFAQFLLVSIALLGVFWKKRAPLWNMLLVPPALFLFFGVYLTFSRGAVLGLVGILYVILSSRVPKPVCVTLAGLVVAVLIGAGFGGGREYSMQEGSAAGRVIAWGNGIADFKAHPLFGVGFGSFADMHELTAHNSFVLCFAELGIFGYFFWLALVLVTLFGLERASGIAAAAGDEAYLGVVNALRAAFYTFLITAWFLSRTYNETLFILFALCGSAIHMRGTMPEMRKALEALRRSLIRRTVVCQFASLVVIYVFVRLRTL